MNKKIIITGGAGIVGINLVKVLVEKDISNIHVIDKNLHNLNLLKKLFPSITIHHYDLSIKGKWENIFVQLLITAGSACDCPYYVHYKVG